MSHCGLETDNRDHGAGFGSLRSRVQRFLAPEDLPVTSPASSLLGFVKLDRGQQYHERAAMIPSIVIHFRTT